MKSRLWGYALQGCISKENVLKYYVKYETNAQYIQGIRELENRGFTIVAIVCDGRKGLIQSFPNIPVKMCQYHQIAIIRRYLTKKPKLKASQELIENICNIPIRLLPSRAYFRLYRLCKTLKKNFTIFNLVKINTIKNVH